MVPMVPMEHSLRKKKLNRKHTKVYLLTASAFLGLATSHALPIIDSGENVFGIHNDHSTVASPFYPTNVHHVLETSIEDDESALSKAAFINKVQFQYFDAVEDGKVQDWSFVPLSVIDHRVSTTTVRTIDKSSKEPEIKLSKQRQVRVKTVWRSGEISWTSVNALKLQNPWILVNYAKQ